MSTSNKNNRKSMFLPPDVSVREIPPLSLGDGFQMNTIRSQGFYNTGEWYLMREDPPMGTEVQIHMIRFNPSTFKYERKLLVVLSPVYEIGGNMSTLFDAWNGKLLLIPKKYTDEKIILDIHYIDITEFFTMKYPSIVIEVGAPDLRLTYNREDYTEVTVHIA